MKSNDNIVRIFPAWPKNKNAEFTNLRARGGFLVSSKLTDGIIESVTVQSTIGVELKMVSPWDTIKVKKSHWL